MDKKAVFNVGNQSGCGGGGEGDAPKMSEYFFKSKIAKIIYRASPGFEGLFFSIRTK
jgi:hypothetical protein